MQRREVKAISIININVSYYNYNFMKFISDEIFYL